MKVRSLTKRQCLLGILVLTVINISLVIVITSVAQSSSEISTNQPPLRAEALRQGKSPLTVTIVDVDNSNRDFQMIRYHVQNMSPRSARGYVILGNGSATGKVITSFFPSKPFLSGSVNTEEMAIERSNLRSGEGFSLSVDYVEFDDGSWWGADSQGGSESLAGKRAGALAAIEYIENLINGRQSAALSDIRKKKLAEVDVPLPTDLNAKGFRWREGFKNGYKGILGFLKNEWEKGENEILAKLRSARTTLNTESRQEQ